MEIRLNLDSQYWFRLWDLIKNEPYIKYVEVIKTDNTEHPLKRLIGSLDDAEGVVMANLIDKEFNKIEGE